MSKEFTYIRSVFDPTASADAQPDGAVALEPGFTLAFAKEPVRVTTMLSGEPLYRELGDIIYQPETRHTHVIARDGITADELEALLRYATRTSHADKAKWPAHMRLADRCGICVIHMAE